jgi:hypothetical protein
VASWSSSAHGGDSDAAPAVAPHGLQEDTSTWKYFLQQIANLDADSRRNKYKNEEGFVTGGSVGWHLNPLLLEPRYARVVCASADQ